MYPLKYTSFEFWKQGAIDDILIAIESIPSNHGVIIIVSVSSCCHFVFSISDCRRARNMVVLFKFIKSKNETPKLFPVHFILLKYILHRFNISCDISI